MRARVITVGVALCVACKGSEREVPKPPLAGVRVVDLIPVSLSGESWQDAEPFLALYASNPRLMAASAFTPNPGGSASATAPIFVSDDGGDSWTLRNTLPSQTMTADITHAVGGNPPVLYAGIMKVPDFPLNELKANDLFSPATMRLQGFRADIDQPFVRTSAVVVVRDDSGATGATPFRDLVDPSDHLPGRLVATHVTIPWSNAPTLGQERIGSTLSIAVDALHSDNVYLAWADRVGTGDIYTVHVRRSTDRGATWSSDLRTLTNATDASLAVSTNGTVGLLYQQVTGSASTSRWVTRLEQSRDGFATHQDVVLATVPAATPSFQFLPYIGDYNCLLTRGNQFLGIFSANNTPDSANFPQGVVYQRRVDFPTHRLLDGSGAPVAVSIDPFFFSVPVLP